MAADRPIFILGPHRSGTTLLYGMLARHPDVAFLNRANHRLPRHPALARLWTRLGAGDAPREAQRVWDRFGPGDDDSRSAAEATPEVAHFYRAMVETVCRQRGAGRFVAKYPRLSLRVPWLDAIFPDALYVHLLRDWRAVVSSTLERKEKRARRGGGWFGVRIPGWREMGELPHALAAGRVFRVTTLALEAERARRPERFHTLRFEDLCAEPLEVLEALAAFAGLRLDAAFRDSLPALRNPSAKWRERLDPAAIQKIRAEDPAFYARHER